MLNVIIFYSFKNKLELKKKKIGQQGWFTTVLAMIQSNMI